VIYYFVEGTIDLGTGGAIAMPIFSDLAALFKQLKTHRFSVSAR
jgi:hypothetical protein